VSKLNNNLKLLLSEHKQIGCFMHTWLKAEIK